MNINSSTNCAGICGTSTCWLPCVPARHVIFVREPSLLSPRVAALLSHVWLSLLSSSCWLQVDCVCLLKWFVRWCCSCSATGYDDRYHNKAALITVIGIDHVWLTRISYHIVNINSWLILTLSASGLLTALPGNCNQRELASWCATNCSHCTVTNRKQVQWTKDKTN